MSNLPLNEANTWCNSASGWHNCIKRGNNHISKESTIPYQMKVLYESLTIRRCCVTPSLASIFVFTMRRRTIQS